MNVPQNDAVMDQISRDWKAGQDDGSGQRPVTSVAGDGQAQDVENPSYYPHHSILRTTLSLTDEVAQGRDHVEERKGRRSRRCQRRWLRRHTLQSGGGYYDDYSISVKGVIKQLKLTTRRKTKALLPLDTLSTNFVNVQKLESEVNNPDLSDELRADLKTVLGFLTSRIEFEKLIDPIPFEEAKSMTVNPRFEADMEALKEMKKVIETTSREPPKGPTVGYAQVPKSNGVTARPIGNCIPINEAMVKPPHFHLCTPAELVDALMQCPYVCYADMLSWFTQIPVEESIGTNYFRMRLRNGKEYAFTFIPQGWSYSPFAAQTIAKVLGGERPSLRSITYDNFVWAGELEALIEAVETYRARCKEFEAEINEKKSMLTPTTRAVVLGVDVDLEDKEYGLDPAWQEKCDALLKAVLNDHRIRVGTFLQVIGMMNWALIVMRIPWCAYRSSLNKLRKVARNLFYESITMLNFIDLEGNILNELDNFRSLLYVRLKWSPPPKPPGDIVYTDASDWGYGAVHLSEESVARTLYSCPWSRPDSATIPIADREAHAAFALIAYTITSHWDMVKRNGGALHVVLDNSVVYFALLKGSSARSQVEKHVKSAYEVIADKSVTLFVSLVKSADMRADGPSRGLLDPTEPEDVQRPLPVLVPWTTGGTVKTRN